jgi:methyl-accepting chemotaxis protein
MAGFVEAIEEIGLRMQRIALNANIKAISIGEQGSALGAVADAIQRLAADSTDQTGVVANAIRHVAQASERLSAELMESAEDLIGELERVMDVFHMADNESGRRLRDIGECGRSFSQEMERLCGAIRADQVLTHVIARSCERLQQVLSAIQALPAGLGHGESDLIRNLESQYTMHAERAVHQQESGEEPVVIAAVGGDLGENVELF